MLPEHFTDDEKLYRAVKPLSYFWEKDNNGELRLSSAALRDSKGLSVDRGYYRSDDEVIDSMQQKLEGKIASFEVKDCRTVQALVLYRPTSNCYHSEVHGSEDKLVLSNFQRRKLAEVAKILT